MTRALMTGTLIAAALTLQPNAGMAQTEISVPGGATGSNVYCMQVGDLSSGAFIGTYHQTGPNTWEERLRAGVFKLEERKRDDLMVELFDAQRSAAIQFDFVNKTVKYKPANAQPNAADTDRYYILNATDKAQSEDCVNLASAEGPGGGPNGAGAGPGGGGSGNGG